MLDHWSSSITSRPLSIHSKNEKRSRLKKEKMIVIQDENANRDNEIAAIFNPKRVRTPSVVITTGESPNGPSYEAGAMTNQNQITHSDSVTSSQPDGAESLTGVIIGDNIIDSHSHHQPTSLTQLHHNQLPRSASTEHEKPTGCRASCCSELAQKVNFDCSTIASLLQFRASLFRCTSAFVSRF